MSCEGQEIGKRTLKTKILFSVPGPGLEPGWIAPTVFETVASTDSAIRALWRLSLRGKGRDFYLNNIKRGEIF